MTGQQLKNSILQEAIQGRLVPNILQPGEKTGAELLQDILAERQKKENTEKGKKAKKLTLSTIEEEPWELPEGWCWCYGKDIFFPMESTKPTSDFVYIDTDAVNNKKNIIDNPKNVLLKDAPSRATRKLHQDDILFSMVRPYLKNIAYVDDKFASAIGTTGFYVITTSASLYRPYLFKLLLSEYVVSGLTEFMKGDNSPSINNGHIENFPYPIPPISIQKAIVAKIEELFPLVDEYDKAAGELKVLNESLPDKLRKSVLQEAIHGTLVPNDIPDGEATAQELLQQILKERQNRENKEKGKKAKKLTLSEIDEEPWELPEGWCWCRLGDLGEFTRGNGIKKDEVLPDGYPCIRYGELYTRYRIQFSSIYSKVSESTFNKSQKIESGDIVMALTGENEYDIALASVYLGKTPVAMGGDMTKLHPYVDSKFLVYVINSPYGIECKSVLATGQIIVHISNDKLASIHIPLPPLSIQHRIVEKIEELFSTINTL